MKKILLFAALLAAVVALAGCAGNADWPGHVKADQADWAYWKPYIEGRIIPALSGTEKTVAEMKVKSRDQFLNEAQEGLK